MSKVRRSMKVLITILLRIAQVSSVLLVLCISLLYSGGLLKIGSFYYNHFGVDETDETGEIDYGRQEPSLPAADTLKTRQAELAQRAVANMVSIKGGRFIMGPDDCRRYPSLASCADSPVYPVQLSDYSISKYKITNQDFDLFLAAHRRLINPFPHEKPGKPGYWNSEYRLWNLRHSLQAAQFPALISWQDADAYCQWVGRLVNQPMHLPTEAQWEYAARNRGQYNGFATDDGTIQPGRNVPERGDMFYNQAEYRANVVNVGASTPNPLGIYDLIGNGREWIYDWYSEKTRGNSLAVDPRGPSEPSYSPEGPAKVVRPLSDGADSDGKGITVHDRDFAGIQPDNLPDSHGQITARCAIWSHDETRN
ncbi:formylglycine-generating enzyme family protein [Brenneria sp. 4F2]|nr:formylglycine-generating enzyme family protein [Brenneria bubanii]